MIVGIGIDIIEQSRIYKVWSKYPERFLSMNYHCLEREILEKYDSISRKVEFLSGRFAAKEAYSKALGLGMKKNFYEIAVLNDISGKPFIQDLNMKSEYKIHISISHNKEHTIAQIILEK